MWKKRLGTSLFILLMLCGCQLFADQQPQAEAEIQNEASEQEAEQPIQTPEHNRQLEETPPLTEREELTVHSLQLMVVGDIMMHSPQIDAGKTEDGYDYYPFFAEVEQTFAKADLVMGNLETTFGGAERGYTGYPLFSTPDELATALKQVGFDVITTANNHSLDRGADGLKRTIDVLEAAGLQSTGTFRTAEEREQILVVEQNEISIAILAYTYGTNGIPIPQGEEYLVNLLNEEEMQRDIELAQQQADFVAVCIHFGAEYQPQPNREQKEWVEKLFEWGADLIFGSHPHVLQPYEFREWWADGKFKQGVVIYSLGNFISNQREHPRDIGGILTLQLSKVGEQTRIEDVDFIPTYVHRFWENGKRGYQVIPLQILLDDRSLSQFSDADYQQLEQRYKQTLEHVIPARKVSQEKSPRMIE
jgi:poly-gamma-glutamate capsule biosynthesis protein CapA/YwtB (metallophosphatase superfamily)